MGLDYGASSNLIAEDNKRTLAELEVLVYGNLINGDASMGLDYGASSNLIAEDNKRRLEALELAVTIQPAVTPPPTDTLITPTGESSFNFGAFDPSRLSVFNSGVAIFAPDVDVSSGNSVVFSEPTLADEELLLTEWPSNITRTETPITSTGQSVFNIVGGFNPLSSYVFLGGKRLVGAEVDISNGTDIVVTDGTKADEIITLVEVTGATFTEAEYTVLGGEAVINVGLYSQDALDIWINGILFYGSNLEYTSSTTVTILNLAPLEAGELVTINKWSN